MRAQEILQIAEENQIPDNFINTHFSESNLGHFIKGIPILRAKVEALAAIPGLGGWPERLKGTELFVSAYPEVTFGSSAAKHHLVRELNELRIEVRAITGLLEAHVSQQTETSIYIKLPSSEVVTEVCDSMIKLEKTIGQLVYHPAINGQIKLRSWESGSLWVEFFLVTSLAVNVVGAAVWAAVVIRKKILEGDAVAEHIRSLKISNDAKETVLKGQKDLIDALVQTEAGNIRANFYQGDDEPETVQRIALVIRQFSEMIGQGTQIHPSLLAAESVKNLFPPVDKLMTLQSKIQSLQEHHVDLS